MDTSPVSAADQVPDTPVSAADQVNAVDIVMDTSPGSSANIVMDTSPGSSADIVMDTFPGSSADIVMDTSPGSSADIVMDTSPGSSLVNAADHVMNVSPGGIKRPHDSIEMQNNPVNRQRIKIRPEGRGMKFVCNPPHLVEQAIADLTERYPKIKTITLMPGVTGGMTIFVNELFHRKIEDLSGVCDEEKWFIVPCVDVREDIISWGRITQTSFLIPQEALEKLNLQDDEKDLIPVLNWFYSMYVSTADVTANTFIIFTANLLGEMGLISKRDATQCGNTLNEISQIDPENIRTYNNAKERFLNATSLPDVDNSFIYNPLTYAPANNTVIAVRKDYIVRALTRFKTQKSRVMIGLLTRLDSDFMKYAATYHVNRTDPEPCQTTVVVESSMDDNDNNGMQTKKRNPRIKIRPEGRGMNFLCNPPHLVEKATSELTERYPKIRAITLTPGVTGGMTMFVKELFQPYMDTLCGVCDDEKWCLTPCTAGEKASNSWRHSCKTEQQDCLVTTAVTQTLFIMPKEALEKLHLLDDEKDMIPILNWLYSFYGSMKDATDDIFLILTANLLGEMGFISKFDAEHSGQILNEISQIDPENIRTYDSAKETLLNATSLPDVENSFIYNPLSYAPVNNTVIAVRKDHILQSFVCFKTKKARVMSGLLARFVSEFLRVKATSHAKEIGAEAFQATVVEPSMEDMRRYCGIHALRTQRELLVTQDELKRERLARVKETIRAYDEEAKRTETERSLSWAQFNHKVATVDKEAIEAEYEHHKLVNRPAQTRTHTGDNLQRVGCVVVKVTNGNDQDKRALIDIHQEHDLVKLDDLNYGRVTPHQANESSALLVNLHVAERTSFQNKRTSIKHCFAAAKNTSSVYREAARPLMTLLGGHRAMDIRTVLREELIAFGGSRKNTLLAIPKGKLSDVAARLTERFKPLFAVGVFDGKEMFINEDIMNILPAADADDCKAIVKDLLC